MLAELENVKMVMHTDMEVSLHFQAERVDAKPLLLWLHSVATMGPACSGVQTAIQSRTVSEAGHAG